MDKIKIAYFGSPDFAADFLEKLITDTTINQLIEVRLVVTQPDQKVGRKQILTPTPVKTTALKHNLEIFEIENLKLNENCKLNIENLDLCLVYAFGDLIPKELLSLPQYGFWNIHPSLLPKYRGPSPIATPLINGDKTTGITLIKMDEEIDHGPIIAQESYTIKDTDYRSDLEKKLTNLGFDLFKKTVVQLTGSRVNELKTKEQNHSNTTYTNKLSKQDGFIEFEKIKLILQKPTLNSSLLIFNLFRGLTPWPGLWTVLPNGKRLKITKITMKQSSNLTIDSVKLEGKKEVGFETFSNANKELF